MSEEGPVVSLEDDDPAPVAVVAEPPPDAPPVEPVVAAPPETDEIDPNDADLLKDEARVKGLIAELSRKRAENRALKPLADRAAQLEQENAAQRPYVEFLKANPGLTTRQAPPEPAAPVTVDPDTIALAKTLDLYDANGQPDVSRAQSVRAIIDKTASQHAAEAVRPWQQASAQEKSNQNFNAVLQMQDPDGNKPSVEAVTAVWKQVLSEPNGVSIASDPRSAAFLAMAAFGIDRMTKKPGVKAPPPALVTEGSGGTPRARASLSGLEERVATDRGRTGAQWQELTKGHQTGRPSVLED